MKTVLLLLLLVASTLAYRVELQRDQRESEVSKILANSLATKEVREITSEEILNAEIDRSIPLTTNRDEIKILNNPSIDLTNFQDLQYYGPADLGTSPQHLEFVYDTGSSWIWGSAKGCKNCPGENRFDSSASSTFEGTSERKELFYGKGYAAGNIAHDVIGLPNSEQARAKFLPADESKDMEGTKADGIIGLTPVGDDADLFVDKLAEEGVISGQEFTVYIGKEGFDNSFIDFGLNEDDQSEVTWVDLKNLPGTDHLIYWSTDFESFSVAGDQVDLTYTSTIWDTGTSLIGFNPDDHKKVMAKITEGKKTIKTADGFVGVKCKSPDEIDSLAIDFGGHTINVDAHEFVIEQKYLFQNYCFVLLMEINLPGALLGDSFLRGSKIIHDQVNQRMGVFPQHHYFTSEADLIKESA